MSEKILNEEDFWDDSALELSEEEVEKLNLSTQEIEIEKEEEIEEADENSSEEDSDESENEEEEEIEEDEVVAKGFELFKDSVFKYLPEDYKFKATEEGFEEALKTVETNLVESIHNQYLVQLEANPKAKSYLDFLVQTEGLGDYEKWQKVNNTDISSFKEEDMSDPELAKVVYSEYLKFQGLEDADILQKLEDAEDYGTLEKEAKIALKYIPKVQAKETDKLIEDYKAQKKSRDEVYEGNYNLLQETAKQIKLPKEKSQELIDAIMKPVRTQGGYETTMFNHMLTQVQTHPQHILQLAALIMDYTPEKGFSFDKITEKKENTKVNKNFREKLAELEKASPMSRSKTSYESHKKAKAPSIIEGDFI